MPLRLPGRDAPSMEPASGRVALRPGYPVALGMILVIVSFAASLGYSHFLLRPIDDQALSILQDAIPSLQHLANVRLELAHLRRAMRDFSSVGGASGDEAEHAVTEVWASLHSEFRLYRGLANSAAEAPLILTVEQRLDALERATFRVTTLRGSRAAGDALPAFEPALEQTDSAVGMLQRLSERQARGHATAILRARHDATVMATLLGNASLAIAIVATLLVLRVLRNRDRLTQDYLRLQRERSAELEAFAGRVAHDLRDPLSAIALQVLAATRRGH